MIKSEITADMKSEIDLVMANRVIGALTETKTSFGAQMVTLCKLIVDGCFIVDTHEDQNPHESIEMYADFMRVLMKEKFQ